MLTHWSIFLLTARDLGSCFGTTHFCEACHEDPGTMQEKEASGSLPPCPAGPRGKHLEGKCPLGIDHPPTGTEFCLGCPMCKEAKSF